MDRSQHYSLRWNNHQSHVLSAFDTLLQNESLVDCTIMCEDSAVRAHKVVLSACSPYFQKIFMDNPGKHPIIVLKDVRCWEMQCILDFMYKGETSVPEPQITSLIKAAESLKVRGLTSSDQLPHGVSLSSEPSPTNLSNGYRAYSPSPHSRYAEPAHKLAHLSGGPHSNESSPMSLTHQDQMSDRSRSSPTPNSATCPRRKQARPRRRSGDSVNSSLDLSKAGSPPLTYKRESPHSVGDEAENLSIRRSGSPGPHTPAINLVKMEQLVEDRDHRMQDNISDGSLDRDCDSKPHLPEGMDRPVLSNGIHHLQEQEALQALNFMASGGGLPHPLLPPPIHSPIHQAMSPHLPPNHGVGPYSPMLHKSPNGPNTSSPSYTDSHMNLSSKPETGLEYQRISIDRSKLSEDEAFEHAIEMIQSRQMGFRKAADFFQVSKWKLYKTARKRGIYAEIKKQNQAHALSKIPTNVQHFAELGVYKQVKKKMPTQGDKYLFPHLPLEVATNLHTYPLNQHPSPKVLNLNNNNLPRSFDKVVHHGSYEKLHHSNFDKIHGGVHTTFDKYDKRFDVLSSSPVKSFNQNGLQPLKPLEIKTFDKPLPYKVEVKNYNGMDEPIKLVKPVDRRNDEINDIVDDDDDDDRLLVIAHRENGNHDDHSDHDSSERADDSAGSV